MGLDIYVNRLRRKYGNVNEFATDYKAFNKKVDAEWENSTLTYEKIEKKYDNLNPRITKILAYFIKVNFLVSWFEKHCGLDNNEIFSIFGKADIADLIETCEEVLTHREKDEDKGVQFAKDNLPTCSGFFFGSTEYANWYFDDVECVLDDFSKIYENATDDDQFLIEFNY